VDYEPDAKDKGVDVVVRMAENEAKVMTLIIVTVPLVLVLFILLLIYAIINTLQKKVPCPDFWSTANDPCRSGFDLLHKWIHTHANTYTHHT
jgi:nitrate/nitrite-specific signal transduction histidine kinase